MLAGMVLPPGLAKEVSKNPLMPNFWPSSFLRWKKWYRYCSVNPRVCPEWVVMMMYRWMTGRWLTVNRWFINQWMSWWMLMVNCCLSTGNWWQISGYSMMVVDDWWWRSEWCFAFTAESSPVFTTFLFSPCASGPTCCSYHRCHLPTMSEQHCDQGFAWGCEICALWMQHSW